MMMQEHTSPSHGSLTEVLLSHEHLDYSEWYSNFLNGANSHTSIVSHSPLPSIQPTLYYSEQSLSRLAQQHDLSHNKEHVNIQYQPQQQQVPTFQPQQFQNYQHQLQGYQHQQQGYQHQQQGYQHLQLAHQQQSSSGSAALALPAVALPPSGSLPRYLPAPIPQPVLHKPVSIPEFTYSTNGASLELPPSIGDTAIWQLPEPLHRNYYHTIQFRVPSAAYATTPNLYGSYESYRVYIHPELGYSGNAKRFKQAPEPGEKAFMLEGTVLDSALRPITQCAACEEYFENKSYFIANPHCKGRILLIKNNQVNRIKNNVFSLNLKPMCCSRHHQSPFYLHFLLRDTVNSRVVMSTLFMSHVKQWKKTSATPKRRKTTHTPTSSPPSSSSSSATTSPDICISPSSTAGQQDTV